MRRALTILVVGFALTAPAQAHWQPGVHNTLHAINWAFCHHSYKSCALGREAIEVSRCETGDTFYIWSGNGQYLGLFQMGSTERATWGFGNDPWQQAASAYRMYKWTSAHESGVPWHRWSCRPDGTIAY